MVAVAVVVTVRAVMVFQGEERLEFLQIMVVQVVLV
jgi:hypothetical protein